MKKIIAFFLVAIFTTSLAFAQVVPQNDPVTQKQINKIKVETYGGELSTMDDYSRYINNSLKMDYRNTTIEALDLNSDQIMKFDPIFRDYLKEKTNSLEKRVDLLKDYREEMAEDDSKANEMEDKTDFIEDYWEIDIAQAELRKDYFDRFEDVISTEKAKQFFVWETTVENRVTDNVLKDIMPIVFDINENKDKAAIRKAADSAPITKSAASMGTKVGNKKYEKYLDAKLQMDIRNTAFTALNLTEDEIMAFDPIFADYMAEKESLLENRMDLLKDHQEELAEDDSRENEEEDTADYLEDYYEIDIAAKELRKDYFDILEDKIDKRKAAKFFLWEDAIENRVTMNAALDLMPKIVVFEDFYNGTNNDVAKVADIEIDVNNKATLSTSTQTKIKDFKKWVLNNRGEVDKSHEYTSNGLKALVGVLEAVNNDHNNKVSNFASQKSMIIEKANAITRDWKSTDHADWTKDAFQATAGLMYELGLNTNAKTIANNMKDHHLMTKQENTIYDFFNKASSSLEKMMNKDNMASSSSSTRSSSMKKK